ncbi:YjaG family protein [Lacimicrobium sp. SS2-24]|uniref:YjaG family protein n=1 Tax=Lacimicrobium sp. SS2-24 TaxID=2005569 RepID=UPI000B4B8B40|nr:YjaG family protein [Lacimicrobium sp. SS2-24]
MKLTTFARARQLSGWQAIAFGATLLERSLPNYQLFCEVTGFADPQQYRNTLDGIWDWLANPKAKLNLAVQLEKTEQAVPDAADFDNFGVYPAIDVGISLTSLLLLMMDEDPQGAVVISKLSQGSVEAFIEASSDAALGNDEIKAHPLMQWEIAFQQELLDKLEQIQRNKDSMQALKRMAVEEGITNIGLEIG